jgi:hypothetical protein
MAAEKEAEMAAESEKADEPKPEEKKFQIESMGKFFSDDEDADDVKMAKEEMAKGENADFGIIMNAVYSKFCKMQAKMAKYEEDSKAYMSENEELKKFKAELESQQKEFTVNQTLKELFASVQLPEDIKLEMKTEAEKYSLGNIEAWKNYCKAKSYDFAIKQPEKPGIIEVGLPFSGTTKTKDDLWASK